MKQDLAEDFTAHLKKLAGEGGRQPNRAALAELRRSLTQAPGTYVRAYRYVPPYVHNLFDRQRDAYFLVAGLFATHSDVAADETLGASIKKLYLEKDSSDSVEKRFITLLDADETQLPYRLRQMISLLRSEGIPVDYLSLLKHLTSWDHPERWVQRLWASDFYRQPYDNSEKSDSERAA